MIHFEVFFSQESQSPGGALTSLEKSKLSHAAKREQPVGQEETRFFGQPSELKMGGRVDAVESLDERMCIISSFDREKYYGRIGRGIDGIEEEAHEFSDLARAGKLESVSSEEGLEVLLLVDYICNKRVGEFNKKYPNGILDSGNKPGSRLADFALHESARRANLILPEVVALRMYTTKIYQYMNIPLRDTARYEQRQPCPMPVATYHAKEGIKKLRKLHVSVQEQEVVLWRGMRNMHVPEAFMASGGTELAFMSTTRDLEVAVRYSLSLHSILFKIVAPDFTALGADLRWLSAFPSEAEVLYPPLTYLKPTGRHETVYVVRDDHRVCFTIIELRPTMTC